MDDLQKLLRRNKIVKCEECGEKMLFQGGGAYKCKNGHVAYDEYGKVKSFLEENGPAPSIVIERATGVKRDTIENYLKIGRVEIPEGSQYYIHCERCGCQLRYGTVCPVCASREDINYFDASVGQRPRKEAPETRAGRMHFLNRHK